jgi:glycosyltransferase involved in cell wall biosynthesis
MSRRIAILTEIIAPYRIPVFNALARHPGIDLHVIFLAETDEKLREWEIYKDEIRFSYEVLASWRWRAGRHNLLLNRGLRSSLKRFNPRVILCGGYNYVASWEALWWARRNDVEFVLWSESNGEDARRGRPWTEMLKRYFLRHCDRFVVPGKASLRYLTSLECAESAIVTAPNAVDNELFAARAAGARAHAAEFRERLGLPTRFILFVGRVVEEKGVFDLLEAYAKLESELRSQVALVYAGDGASRRELEQLAGRVKPGTVCFPGFAQRDDLGGFYGLAEMLVLPTHSDPWGLVVNEAMACGLPIIVTSVAGCAADLVEDGWNGYVVPPRDVDGLGTAIDAILRDSQLRNEMGAHSEERIREFSPEVCAGGLATAASVIDWRGDEFD